MMVAIAVMIGSFRETVVYWVGQTLKADLFIGPGHSSDRGLGTDRLAEDVIGRVATHPDVVALDQFRNVDLVYDGNLAVLGAGSFDVVLEHGGLLFKSPADARGAAPRSGQDAVIVSEPFAMRYGKRDGDVLQMPTPQGTNRSASRRSTTTTRAIAAWW